jgi:WD40 repeat protein
VIRATFAPDGASLVSCGDDGKIFAWDIGKGEARLVGQHQGGVFAVAFLPGGHEVIACGADRTIRTWNYASGAAGLRLEGAHQQLVGNLALSPDGARVVTVSWDGTAKVRDAKTGGVIRELPAIDAPVWGAAFVGPERVVLGGYDGAIRVFSVATGALIDRISLATSTDWSGNLVPLADGKSFLAGTGRGVVLRFTVE